mmetsp:Transcript_16446/g.32482  ORF Transcript_16446/g.32482 Transcript_16446/m.32482 type:complete len:128 (-) Transcript_16446:20-403(-)
MTMSCENDSSGHLEPPKHMQGVEWLSRAEGGKGPQQRMFDEADALHQDVFVARDASFGKGAKEYASLQNHEQLAKMLLSSLGRECCMYELIREGMPCKLYLDLEWEWVPQPCYGPLDNPPRFTSGIN